MKFVFNFCSNAQKEKPASVAASGSCVKTQLLRAAKQFVRTITETTGGVFRIKNLLEILLSGKTKFDSGLKTLEKNT